MSKTIKWVSSLLLPFIGSVFFLLSAMLIMPNEKETLGVIVLFNFGMGVTYTILELSGNKKRVAGILAIDTKDPQKDVYRLEVNSPLDTLKGQKQVSFKVLIDPPKTHGV